MATFLVVCVSVKALVTADGALMAEGQSSMTTLLLLIGSAYTLTRRAELKLVGNGLMTARLRFRQVRQRLCIRVVAALGPLLMTRLATNVCWAVNRRKPLFLRWSGRLNPRLFYSVDSIVGNVLLPG